MERYPGISGILAYPEEKVMRAPRPPELSGAAGRTTKGGGRSQRLG
jgi:hypothetical protein